jgi:hypothetical protein
MYFSTANFSASSGTFTDPLVGGLIPSSVTAVHVQIQDISAAPHSIPVCIGPCAYWDQSSGWTSGAIYSTATIFQSSWVLTGVPSDWVRGDSSPDGRQYAIRVLATDAAGNTGAFPNYFTAVATVTFDGTKPQTWIVSPPGPDGNTATSLATITGTAADVIVNSSSADVSGVSISILNDAGNAGDPNAGFYWNTNLGAWVPSVYWNATAYTRATGVWTFSSPALDSNLRNLSRYVIVSSATDYAGNYQGLQASGSASRSEIIFQPPPSFVGITAPQSLQYYNQLNGLQGTANGVTVNVQLTLQRLDTGECWGGGSTGFSWVNCATQLSTATRVVYPSGSNWAYPPSGEVMPDWGLLNNTTFTLTVAGVNNASILGTQDQVSFFIDRSSPTSSVTFPVTNTFVASAPTLTGPSVDAYYGQSGQVSAAVKTVRFRLKRTDNNYYWSHNTSTWVAAVTASTASYNTLTRVWSYTSSISTLT